jgi:hypothetical protein
MTISMQRDDMLMRETMMNEATDMLLACLSSIPREKIDPKNYWSWAQKALKISGDGGTTYERMISIMHRELQMGDTPFKEVSAKRLYSIGLSIQARNDYQDFRRMVRDHAPYVVILARVRKDEMKAKSAANEEDWINLEEI